MNTPLRIFLSYGHDANEDLVVRIKADLEKRGHDVWFDKSDIKAGDDWRRSITDGITASHRVLSFLSKHSTRDPGVCLDEIRIAIGAKGGNIQSILVESEQEVKLPPSISHIQWLDMHDWQERRESGESAWETWYKEKLAEIIRVVESDESRKFAGEIRTLEEYLKPVVSDFAADARIQKLLEKKLTGRAWLFEAVEKWRTGSAFTGSADLRIGPLNPRAAPLPKGSPASDAAAFHGTPPIGDIGVPSAPSRLFWLMGAPGFGKSFFAAHLAHFYGRGTVIGVHFCAYDKPDHRSAPRIIRTLAFQLATRLPDYRKLLLTLPEIAELDRKQTAAELFDYLLANPLKLSITGGRERLLIVIDALDEAGGEGRNELVEMLARHAPSLPDWIGLVVTSRPESDVRAPLQGLNPFVLDTATEANRADLREYLRHELAPQLQPRPDADRLVEQILEKSEGVFLYAERFCDDVQRGHLSLNRPEQFPQGLGGIFFQYFQRQFPDLEKFRKDVRPALRAILAAREPLPVEILQRLFHWQDEELRDFTRPLGSLFPVAGEAGQQVIKPFHKSLADWLADEAKAATYFVSVLDGHRMLGRLGWSDYEQGKLRGYLSANLSIHLFQIGEFANLYALVRDLLYVSGLGIGRYRTLPPSVRLWFPDELKAKIDDEHGKPGDWRLVQYDGGQRPDSIWQTCVRCGCSPNYYDQPGRLSCPECGWAGSEDERATFNNLEAEHRKHFANKEGAALRKQVFVAFAPADAPFARRLVEHLIGSGFVVWIDVHTDPGLPEESWQTAEQVELQNKGRKAVADAFRRDASPISQPAVWLEAGNPHLLIRDIVERGFGFVLFLLSEAFAESARCRYLVDHACYASSFYKHTNMVAVKVGNLDSSAQLPKLRDVPSFDFASGRFETRVTDFVQFLTAREQTKE